MTDERPEWDERTFLQLGDLAGLATISTATLATAIERYGIQGWDRYGRFTTFKAGDSEAVMGLKFLAKQYEWNSNMDNCQEHTLSPAEAWDGPGYGVGWFANEAPDFDAIAAESKGSPPKPPKQHSKREETSNLNIIAAMLDFLLRKASYKSEAALIDDLLTAGYDDYDGISKRTLEKRFAAAKKSLHQ